MWAEGGLIGGRYRILRCVGKGGMGAVWAAKNEAVLRDVAIKVLLPEVAKHPQIVERFFNEARICGALHHPNIVEVLDMGQAEDGSPFIVMEMLQGLPLSKFMEQRGPLPPAEILPIVRDVARTLILTHQKSVVHRDLKPDNLFLHHLPTGQTIVKILDFGISKIQQGEGSVKLTRTGAVMGSPAYMSPEQASGQGSLDHRTDIYSLGVVLYEALSQRLPFQNAENYNALIIALATQDPPDITTVCPGLPPGVVALVRDAMKRDVNQRIQTMAEFAERIDRELGAPSVGSGAVVQLNSTGVPMLGVAAVTSPGAGVSTSGVRAPQPSHAENAYAATVNGTGSSERTRSTPVVPIIAAVGVVVVAALGGAAFLWSRSSDTPETASSVQATATTSASAPVALPVGTAAPTETAPVASAPTAPSASAVSAPNVPSTSSPTGKSNTSTKTTKTKKGGIWGYD